MPDEPKISKHHAGQHPTLQSFRAFDIIPPNKVKPAHTARPVITTTQPEHFDTTLTPKKAESSKVEPQSAPGLNTDKPASEQQVSASEPEAPATPAPALENASSEQPAVAPNSTAGDPADISGLATLQEAPAEEGPKAPEPSPEADAPEPAKGFDATPETMPANPIPDPDSPQGIIEQEMTAADGGMTPAQKLNHSHEFNAMLQEFASQPSTPNPDHAKPHVVVHRHDYLRLFNLALLWLLAIVVVAAIIFDILADSHVLKNTYGLPHTHFFSK